MRLFTATNPIDYYDYPAVKLRMVQRNKNHLQFTATVMCLGYGYKKNFKSKAEATRWAAEYVPKEFCPVSYYQRFGTACE